MISTETATVVNFNRALDRFCELTDWSTAHLGAWNSDFSKPFVFTTELLENTLQYEQDWMCFYYPNNYEHVTVDEMSLLVESEKSTYKGKDIYNIPFGAILRWLVLKGELVDIDEFLVKN